MIKKYIVTGLPTILLFCTCCKHSAENQQNDKAADKVSIKKYSGYVPDESTARKIAEAIWLPIYSSSVLDEKPYKVTTIGHSVWVVEGTLGNDKSGGTAYIAIKMIDRQILTVTHSK